MKSRFLPFLLLIILGFIVFFSSILGVINDEDWTILVMSAYTLLIFLSILLILLRPQQKIGRGTIEEFEKTLAGKLYHFKCQTCDGVFALKKSKKNNKKPVKMTCPDCGAIGYIPATPRSIEGEIPEKKSVNVNFKCRSCGEWIAIWAEGTDLHPNLSIYSCPYCGESETMKKV